MNETGDSARANGNEISGGRRRFPISNNYLLSVIDAVVVSGASFVATAAIARTGGQDELGLYTLGIAVVFTLIDAQTSLISTPYMIYGPRVEDAEERRWLAGRTILQHVVFFGATLVALTAVSSAMTIGGSDRHIAAMLRILAPMAGLILLKDAARRLCFAEFRLATAFKIDVAAAAVQVALLLALALMHRLTAITAFAAIGVANGGPAVAWMWTRRAHLTMPLNRIVLSFRENWRLSKWVFASGATWILCVYTYPWTLAAFHDTAEAGVWGACAGVVSLAAMVLGGLQNYYGPQIARAHSREGVAGLRRSVERSALAQMAIMFAFAAFAWPAGDWLLDVLYGAAFRGYGRLVVLYSVAVLALSAGFSFSRGLFTLERADLDFFTNVVALVATLTLGFGLARSRGAEGAVLGLLAVNVLAVAIRAAAFYHCAADRPPEAQT